MLIQQDLAAKMQQYIRKLGCRTVWEMDLREKVRKAESMRMMNVFLKKEDEYTNYVLFIIGRLSRER